MEVLICSSKNESALCTLSIPTALLYEWYLTRKDGCYSEKLNSCIAGKAMMLSKTHLVDIGACRTVKVPGQRIIMSAREARRRKISVLIIFISGRGHHLIGWLL